MTLHQLAGTAVIAQGAKATVYDTPDQTKAKEYELALWTVENQKDVNHPVYITKEYWDKVVAIVKNRRPRPVSYEGYESLDTKDADITGKGQWFANVVLTLGLNS